MWYFKPESSNFFVANSKVITCVKKGFKYRKRERIKISSFGVLPCYNLHNWYYCIVIISSAAVRLEIQDLSKRKEHLLTMFPNTNRTQFMRTETSLLLDLAFPLTNLASFQTQLHCFQVRVKNWNRVYDFTVGFFCGWKCRSRHHGKLSWLDMVPSRQVCPALLWAILHWPTVTFLASELHEILQKSAFLRPHYFSVHGQQFSNWQKRTCIEKC